MEYLKSNPTTANGTHFKEFVVFNAWDSYLKKMPATGTWGDWVTLMGLVNMVNVDVAVVSSLGQDGLRIISPTTLSDHTEQDVNMTEGKSIDGVVLLVHEAEKHYHSLEPMCSTLPETPGPNHPDVLQQMIEKYGQGQITKEICQKCGKKMSCYSARVYNQGVLFSSM